MCYRYLFKLFFLSGIFALLLFSSCKKEYLNTPYNDIESFVIKDALNNELKASLKGDSIIVYWPPFQNVKYKVTPEIMVSSGASISPSSGQEINLKTGISYSVTAQDGSIKKYVLKVAINQPVPIVSRISLTRLGQVGLIIGEYFIPDSNQTKLFLVDKQNKEYQIHFSPTDNLWSSKIQFTVPLDAKIDTGNYQVKLISGTNTLVKGPFTLGKPFPASTKGVYQFDQAGKSVKKGDQISFTYALQAPAARYYYGNYTHAIITVAGDTGGKTHIAPIASQSNTSLKFTLPATISTGAIRSIELYSAADKLASFGYSMYTWSTTAATATIITP
ncbi:hypothetical protein [Pedobacter sp. CFBP9032]|uniref:hypothetical protein n=1 Tax=Pedobacter sp. CFBP9032 TaxID=3096539 RepID=UPI002A6B0431|nr:hypothetical protein [Pedobacter sp. CFBP9032]MDY0907033.1 hypothetical protein [Pedobacter sp. CFBP9032]